MLLFSCQVMSDSLWLHSLQHTRLPSPLHFLEFAQVRAHWIGDGIQTSHPLSAFFFCLQSFPASESFPVTQLFTLGGQSIVASASASVLLKSIWGWFPLRLTGFELLGAPGTLKSLLHQHSSKTSVLQHSAFFIVCPALTCVHDYWKEPSLDYTDLCQQRDVFAFNTLSRFVRAFQPRSNCLLILWLQSPSTVISEPMKRKSVTASTFSPSICHVRDGTRCHDLSFFFFFNYIPLCD